MEGGLSLTKIHKRYVKGTKPKDLVVEETFLLTILTKAVVEGISALNFKVYITTVALKHMYDKKPAEEFDAILRFCDQVIKFPDEIYENKPGKRGQFVFVKTIKEEKYFCAVEKVEGNGEDCYFVVTALRVRDENYLRGYKLLWSWRGDCPSS